MKTANQELTEGSEQQSLPLQRPDIEAAQALFVLEEDNDVSDSDADPKDIMNIIHSRIKEAKKCTTKHAIKMLCQLIAVSEYIKLQACYQKLKACKQPCLHASLAIARRMGKGPYMAHQIRHNELHLL